MSSHNFKRTKTTIQNKNLNNNNKQNEKTSSSRSTFHVKNYSIAPTTLTETLNSSIDRSTSSKMFSQKKSTKRFSTLMQQSMDILTNKKPIIVKKVAFGNVLDQKSEEFKIFQKKNENSKNVKIVIGTNKKALNIFKYGVNKQTIEKIYKQHRRYNSNEITFKTETKFPIINSKKILKNLLPKEYDYNHEKTSEEVLKNVYHPLVRYQKKMLNKHINAINREIGVEYSNYFTIANKNNFSEQFQMCQDLIDLQSNEKLVEMINRLINNNFKLNKEVKKIIDINELNEKYLHNKKILQRFKEILIRCAIHFKRLNISLEQFYKLDLDSIQPFSNKESYTLICAIKDKDINNINKLLKNNYFLVYDFDHFKQTPLHWAAKRNVYQVISLIVSKGANVNAKDHTGRTPLHVAAAYNNLEAVEALVYDLAESSVLDNEGLLAEDLTNDRIIKSILKRVRALHKLNKTMFCKNFESTIKNGLHYFFMNELKINFLKVKVYEYVKN